MKGSFLFLLLAFVLLVQGNHLVNIKTIHAVAGGPQVDIYANETLLFPNFSYGEYSSYYPVLPGLATFTVVPAGVPLGVTDLITQEFTFPMSTYWTFGVVGSLSNPDFPLGLVFIQDSIELAEDRAQLRTIHFSADSGVINIEEGGVKLWESISYPNAGEPEYVVFDANKPTLVSVEDDNTHVTVAGPTLINLARNTVNTLFVIGIADSAKTPLTIVVQRDFIRGQASSTSTPSLTSTRSPSATRSVTPSHTPSRTQTSGLPSESASITPSTYATRSAFRTSPFEDDDDNVIINASRSTTKTVTASQTPSRTASQSRANVFFPSSSPIPFSPSPTRSVDPDYQSSLQDSASTILVASFFVIAVLVLF